MYGAWQTITSAYDQPGNGGRFRALEFLNASPDASWRWKFVPRLCEEDKKFPLKFLFFCFSWPKESLAGINLAVEQEEVNEKTDRVFLQEISLPGADLTNANLESAFLSDADFREASLLSANLQNTVLGRVDLTDADLQEANLGGAFLQGADLQGANLQGANLEEVNLQGAILWRTQLERTNINDFQLEGELPPILCVEQLPDGIDISPERDCDFLADALTKKYPEKFKDTQAAQKYIDSYQD